MWDEFTSLVAKGSPPVAFYALGFACKHCRVRPHKKSGLALTCPNPMWMPKDSKALNTRSMIGWFAPDVKHLYTITVHDVLIPFTAMGL